MRAEAVQRRNCRLGSPVAPVTVQLLEGFKVVHFGWRINLCETSEGHAIT